MLAAITDYEGAVKELEIARTLRPDEPAITAELDRVSALRQQVLATPPPPTRAEPPAEKMERHPDRGPKRQETSGDREALALFQRGQKEADQLDLFGARVDLSKALESAPSLPGLREYTAWFLFLNGFHDRQCLELFKSLLPAAADPASTNKAIVMLQEELGLEQATRRDPVPRPSSIPPPPIFPPACNTRGICSGRARRRTRNRHWKSSSGKNPMRQPCASSWPRCSSLGTIAVRRPRC